MRVCVMCMPVYVFVCDVWLTPFSTGVSFSIRGVPMTSLCIEGSCMVHNSTQGGHNSTLFANI